MSDIWDALQSFEQLEQIGHLVWWYNWGCFVAMTLVVAALIWVFYEAQNRGLRRLSPFQIAVIVAIILLLPSILIRLFPLTLLRLVGFDQDIEENLYERLIGFIQGEWDPLEDLRMVKNWLLGIAAAGWVGTIGGFASAAAFALGQTEEGATHMAITCQNCGRELDISWEYCPYCSPMQQAMPEPDLQIDTSVAPSSLPPTVVEPPPAAFPQPAVRQAPPVAPTVPLDQPAPTVAWLVVQTGARAGRQFPIRGDLTIGRDPTKNEITLDDPKVSSRHARIRQHGGRFLLHDMASTNGTFVNGQLVQRHLLMDGDCVRLGSTELVFREVRS